MFNKKSSSLWQVFIYLHSRDRDGIAVSIDWTSGWTTKGSHFDSQHRQKTFLFFKTSRLVLMPTQLPGASSLEIRWPGMNLKLHLHLVHKLRMCEITPQFTPYAFMACTSTYFLFTLRMHVRALVSPYAKGLLLVSNSITNLDMSTILISWIAIQCCGNYCTQTGMMKVTGAYL